MVIFMNQMVLRNKRILIIVLIVVILFIVVIQLLFLNDHMMTGRASVSSDEFQIEDMVECTWDLDPYYASESRKNVEVNCKRAGNGICFKNKGTYGWYTYVFKIYGEGIKVYPRIHFDRAYSEEHEKWEIVFELHRVDGRWDATVRGSRNGSEWTTVECVDIEKNGIELEFWEEGRVLQEHGI